MLRHVFSFLLIWLLAITCTEAQSPNGVGASTAVASTNADSGAVRTVGESEAPWYSLFLDNRSDRFAALRLQRTELMRALTALEAEVKELRDKNSGLDDQVKRLVGAGDTFGSLISASRTQDQTGELARLKLSVTHMQEAVDIDIASKQAQLDVATKFPEPGRDQAQILASLNKDISELTLRKKQDSELMQLRIKELERQIAQASEDDERFRAIQQASDEEQAKNLADAQKALTDNGLAILQKRNEIAAVYAKIDAIDADVLKLIDVGDTDGWFKIIISCAFALLVAGVIYGFFSVISEREHVIGAIFSNDSGIQFVTIFSIIIAVILFGIIGVLEGRELSALLGGLSGYILGRNAATQKPATPVDLSGESGKTAADQTNSVTTKPEAEGAQGRAEKAESGTGASEDRADSAERRVPG